MNTTNLIATAQTTINADTKKVWDALTSPDTIKKYMFGTTAVSDWREGSNIIWKGEWKGKSYEDKGKIVKSKPERLLQYTHFSPLTGQPDIPENYHTVTIELENKNGQTQISLSQDNNHSEEEQQHSVENWKMMLEQMKKVVEEQGS